MHDTYDHFLLFNAVTFGLANLCIFSQTDQITEVRALKNFKRNPLLTLTSIMVLTRSDLVCYSDRQINHFRSKNV